MKTAARAWLEPLRRLLRGEAASGVVLALATVVALAWANSPWRQSCAAVFDHVVSAHGGLVITTRWVIDDVLMSVFFFVVGLELRTELSIGALSDRRRAMLPLVAAAGGMVAPALVYLCAAHDAATRAGWGVPTATDIAFALGVLALLGTRVPKALRALLLALAVFDDLGAVVVIAVFYAHGVELGGVALAMAAVLVVLAMQRARVVSMLAYALPGALLWLGVATAGVHPTVAGAILGLLTPATAQSAGIAPARRLITALHPWVTYAVLPLFALANAGVAIESVGTEPSALGVAVGVGLGLVVGKPIGIVLGSLVALRARIAEAPRGIGTRDLFVLGAAGGVGFTMALFVAGLAFEDPALLAAARAGVLAASAIAALASVGLGVLLLPKIAADRA